MASVSSTRTEFTDGTEWLMSTMGARADISRIWESVERLEHEITPCTLGGNPLSNSDSCSMSSLVFATIMLNERMCARCWAAFAIAAKYGLAMSGAMKAIVG